ncbi:MAG: CDP-alcohol phosphatidyltransferase family protein [Chromatiales bacterium]|nr:CDP-alcohol phosphatidyltransferase family protein [Chromatiales bacterium]
MSGRSILDRLAWIPNLICILRILLVAPIVLALTDGRYVVALVLITVAGLSDGLDGWLAKRFDWRTRLGGLLDPAADKILLVAVYITLAVLALIPLWLMVVVFARDLVIVAGALSYQRLVGPLQPAPSGISKVNTAMQLLLCLAVIAAAGLGWPPEPVIVMLGASVLCTSVISGLHYVLHWSALARSAWRDQAEQGS